MEIRDHKDLRIWNKSLDLVVEIYKVTAAFPREEIYGLTNQLRRAAVSIPSNIAEGHERIHRADYIRFLSVSRGSIGEVETQVLIAERLNYLDRSCVSAICGQIEELGRMMNGLISALRKDDQTKIREDEAPYGDSPPDQLNWEEIENLTPDP